MFEQEKQRAAHLMILLCNTIFMITLIGEAIFLGWDKGAVVLLFLGYAACWFLHITEKVLVEIRMWLYIVWTMLTFFFYGIHESSLYELAPVMAVIILVFTAAEEYNFVRFCAVTYYFTLCYDFVFLFGNPLQMPTHTLARILLHFILVSVAERIAEAMIRRRKKEKEKTDARIFQLEEANRRAEDFLANVSHELRTPINAVTGITTVMLKNEEDPSKKKDLLSIQMAGNRLFSQIEDILDYTEIDAGKVIVSEENYMVFSLINDIIVESRVMKKLNQLELIFDIDAGVPAVLLGDGRKVKKIIEHLIDNAVKFTRKGGVYVRVYALHKEYGINLCIKVSDTGVGIAEEELEKIKERFFQASGGRSRRAGGLGLGLSIVYGMVAAMDGFIQLESTKDGGTTVSVSIPQKVADAAPSMEVPNGSELCIALYLRPEKYEVPEVRDYYNTTVTHMIRELNLSVHRVFDLEELKKLVSVYQLTHLVIGKEEYGESETYFEALDKEINVIVVADDHFIPMKSSRINLVRKPFYCLPIVNILNSKNSFETDVYEGENMIFPGVRVLVVDDEPMNLMVAEGIFKAYQMEVKTAGSGMEAVEVCKKEEFDLIFLDHMMPEMDGVETLKLLRKNQSDTGRILTVIAFTANAVSGAKEMFLQEGFDEFISKPIEDQELKRLLKKVLPKTAISYEEKSNRKNISGTGQSSEAEQNKGMQDDSQDTVSESESMKDKLALLEKNGFYTESGLQYCRGDNEFYKEVLVQFAKNADRKIADIEDSFQKEDIPNYQIMVHALKSSSKMIGAETLSRMAKDAEDAAKNQDLDYIRANHKKLIGKYKEAVECIFDVWCLEKSDLSEEPSAAVTEVSKDELLKQLTDLSQSLNTFEAEKAESQIEKMNGLVYQGTPVSKFLRDISQDVEDFELGAASEKVGVLIDRMEGGEV